MSSHIELSRQFPIEYQRASELLGLSSGITELDRLLGFIEKGKIIFVKGGSRKYFLELFCLRAILQYRNYCLFIDGYNSFDPYLLSNLVGKQEKPKEVLSKIILSRAFTCHQLASLIIRELKNIIHIFPSTFIAISDMLHMFTDPESDVHYDETKKIVTKMLKSIRNLASRNNAIMMITSDVDNDSLNAMMECCADTVLTVHGKKVTHVTFDKHYLHQNISIDLTLAKKPATVTTIEPWLMANG